LGLGVGRPELAGETLGLHSRNKLADVFAELRRQLRRPGPDSHLDAPVPFDHP
jgi:hypothetical protein